MQGKLDILAENAGEDGSVAGVCLLQDGYAGNGGFLQDRFGEGPCFFARRLRWGALRGGVPSSAHAVRFASRAPVEAPHPEALRLLEDDFAGVRPVTVENL